MKAHRGALVGAVLSTWTVREGPNRRDWIPSDASDLKAECSYCGSMSVARALELLATAGTRYSGADYKYGWPHKFYLGSAKFYAEHLLDATPDQLALWNTLAETTVQITYEVKDGQLWYTAPHAGFQTYGTTGGRSEGEGA